MKSLNSSVVNSREKAVAVTGVVDEHPKQSNGTLRLTSTWATICRMRNRGNHFVQWTPTMLLCSTVRVSKLTAWKTIHPRTASHQQVNSIISWEVCIHFSKIRLTLWCWPCSRPSRFASRFRIFGFPRPGHILHDASQFERHHRWHGEHKRTERLPVQ